LRRPLLVRVTDGAGNGMADVAVKFEVTGGDGRISTVEPSTNFSGFAATTWTLGTRAGSGHAVTASLPGENTSTVTFHATATAGPGTDLFLVSGDGQQGRPGGRLAEPVVFRVADRFDNPVPNQLVKFIADQGFGSMDPPDQRTDEAGRARASWTLGNVAGVQAASVWSPGLTGSPTRISARAAN
ncbi:MAG: Ig-like domain-containing protein, partial [Gemmatimonadales bacterium]